MSFDKARHLAQLIREVLRSLMARIAIAANRLVVGICDDVEGTVRVGVAAHSVGARAKSVLDHDLDPFILRSSSASSFTDASSSAA